jgi:hypothetical protein
VTKNRMFDRIAQSAIDFQVQPPHFLEPISSPVTTFLFGGHQLSQRLIDQA